MYGLTDLKHTDTVTKIRISLYDDSSDRGRVKKLARCKRRHHVVLLHFFAPAP